MQAFSASRSGAVGQRAHQAPRSVCGARALRVAAASRAAPGATSSSSSSSSGGNSSSSACSSCAAPTAPLRRQRQRPSWVAADAAAPAPVPALVSASIEEDAGPSTLGGDAVGVVAYAVQLAATAETYEVHPWMLLLGVLKDERSLAAGILGAAGIDDPYAAWHEVLWALNVSDGLAPRSFRARVDWSPGARAALDGAVKFAAAAGRDKVSSIDIVLALSAAGVLSHLFPDLDMSLPAVRRAAAQVANEKYVLPSDKGAPVAGPADMFL